MAMMSNNDDDNDVLSEMNVTPLVDVMLVLLVMFIVTASAATTAVKVNLPATDAVAPPDADNPLHVTIDADGAYFLDDKRMDLSALKDALTQAHAKRPDQAAQLQADEGVAYGRVGKAMAALQKAGIQKIAVLSDPDG